MAASTTHDLIFYGSLPVYFKPVEGSITPFSPSEWMEDPTTLQTVLSRFSLLPSPLLENKGLGVVIPAIPALDFTRNSSSSPSAATSPPSSLPEELRVPLMKVPQGTPGITLVGVASGVRSALVKVQGEWYRLKGCGNNDEGFTLRTERERDTSEGGSGGGGGGWVERLDVRGSAFPHTAIRELAMASRLTSALIHTQSLGANTPLGYATYTHPSQLPLGPTYPLACILERTCGDRRLGSHVLSGLELILPLLVDTTLGRAGLVSASSSTTATTASTETPGEMLTRGLLSATPSSSVFPPGRPRVGGLPIPTATFLGDHVLASTYAWSPGSYEAFKDVFALHPFYDPGAGLEFPGLPRDGSSLACLPSNPEFCRVLGACERAPPHGGSGNGGACVTPPPMQYTREGARPMSPQWVPLWEEACVQLKNALEGVRSSHQGASSSSSSSSSSSGSGSGSVLAYLFSRLGYDAGCIIKGMHGGGMNWGTYQDAMCNVSAGAFHCNAHSNNLVVVAPPPLLPDEEGRGGLDQQGQGGGEDRPSHRLLAALDLDMAFDAPHFVHGFPPGKVGWGSVGMEAGEFQRLQWWEYLNLLEVVCGGDASNGVPQVAKEGVSRGDNDTLKALKAALYDTLVCGVRPYWPCDKQ